MGYVINRARAEYLHKQLGLSKLNQGQLGLLTEVVGGDSGMDNYIDKDHFIRGLTEQLAAVEADRLGEPRMVQVLYYYDSCF